MRLRAPRGLRQRLLLALLSVTGAALLIAGTLVYREANGPEETVDATPIGQQADILKSALVFDKAGRLAQVRLDRVWTDAYRAPDLAYYTLYDRAGRPVARSANLTRPLPQVAPGAGGPHARLQVIYPGEYLAAAVAAPHGHLLVVGRAIPNQDMVGRPGADDLWELLGGLIGLAAAAIGIVYLVFEWSLRHLRRASREAEHIGPANPDARLSAEDVPGEIAPLVGAVNASLDRLAQAYATERTLTAAAAHALRTPLAVLHLRLQRSAEVGDPDLPAMRRDVEHLNRLVAQLLSLARKEQGSASQPATQSLDLARLARDCVVSVLPLAEASGRRIALEAGPAAVRVEARAGDLQEAVVNLLENALTHGRGAVTVRIGPGQPGPAWIEVSDEGRGVPPHQREALFGRFHKADVSSAGAGLGLAIVRHVARSLGGDAAFVGPANVRIELPAH